MKDEPPGLDEPFGANLALSMETNLSSQDVVLIKLEDIVAVTNSGCEGCGDDHRDWTAVAV